MDNKLKKMWLLEHTIDCSLHEEGREHELRTFVRHHTAVAARLRQAMMAEFSFLANLLEYDVDFSFLPTGHHFDEVANAMEAAEA